MSRYSGPGDHSGGTTPRQKIREIKRYEAEQRNTATPPEKRRAIRIALDWLQRDGGIR